MYSNIVQEVQVSKIKASGSQ